MTGRHWSVFTLILLGTLKATAISAAEKLPAKTALDRYVQKPDSSYSWKIARTQSADGLTTYIVDMVSQTWRKPNEVNRPRWQHWLTVAVPEKSESQTALLWIGGGRNGGSPPDGTSEVVERIARATNSVAAELKMVPNQALVFHGDGQQRVEDDLIGYTWDQFLKTGDPTWPARNPMVKSAVRAMDTMTALTTSKNGGRHRVDKFVVAGGSKRGWTTWLTGAVDKRVVAIIPIVIDVLKVRESMLHHYAAYGFWAPAVGDYVQHRTMERLNHPRMRKLLELVDPFAYRHRLTMPKYIVNAAGDQFFLPDSSQFYFDELRGEKHLRYVPNADHSLKQSDARESIAAFYAMILAGKERPRFTWKEERNGAIRVTTTDAPDRVLLWQATNPDARDFRMEAIGPKYTSSELEDRGKGVYVGKVAKPKTGWTAYFVELTYDVGVLFPLKLTTSVRVVPNVLPHAKEDPARPVTITIICDTPSRKIARTIEKQASILLRKNCLSRGKIATRRVGTTCHINWQPVGLLREGAATVTAWLREQGCSGFRYELRSGNGLRN